MTCTACELNLLKYYALKGAETPEDRELVQYLIDKAGGDKNMAVDIMELLGLKGDELKLTAGGVAAELYEDEITAKFESLAAQINPEMAGALAKLIPALIARYFSRSTNMSADLAAVLEGASYNLRFAAYADLIRALKAR